jgi:[NiFe] hydrogenase diaphorase moiety large subunit
MSANIQSIVEKYGNDRYRLMDIFHDLISENGCVSEETIDEVAQLLNISSVEAEQTLSFYHFYSKRNCGKYSIYLNNSLVSEMMGRDEVADAFEKATVTKFGSLSDDVLL